MSLVDENPCGESEGTISVGPKKEESAAQFILLMRQVYSPDETVQLIGYERKQQYGLCLGT